MNARRPRLGVALIAQAKTPGSPGQKTKKGTVLALTLCSVRPQLGTHVSCSAGPDRRGMRLPALLADVVLYWMGESRVLPSQLRPTPIDWKFMAIREGRVEPEEEDGLSDFLRLPP